MADTKPLEIVTRDEIKELLDIAPGPAISIFHPTERVAVEAEQNSLRLKNLVVRAHELLEERGLRRPEIESLLEPLNSLLGDADFWHHQLEGLALFRTPDEFRHYRLPYRVDEIAIVAHRLHVKPLLRAVSGDGHYYILAISQNSVRLLRATRHAVQEVDITDLGIPLSLDEALQYDDLQKPELQHHPTMAPGRSDAGPTAPTQAGGKRQHSGRKHAFHGHGEHGEGQKTQIRRFFQGVDSGITKILGSEQAPLVLAAVDYLHPLYREASHYGNVFDKGIEGSPDRLSPEDLHERSLPLIEPYYRKEMEDAKERFGAGLGNGLATTGLGDALRAARDGRIGALFLDQGSHVWGSFNIDTDEIETRDEPAPGDVDLLDQLAGMTVQQNGKVYLVDAAEVPEGGPLAALYRY